MDQKFASAYYSAEDYFWWFFGRCDFVTRVLLPWIPVNARILDAGCGGGKILSELQKLGYKDLHGIDMSPDAVRHATVRGLAGVIQGDACRLPYSDNEFNLIIASDILEHIPDEEIALREWTRVLKPGGTMLIFVPAFKFLWSFHDEENHHVTRYTRCRLVNLARKNGLKIVASGYWNFFLFIPYGIIMFIKKIVGIKKSAAFSNGAVNRILTALIAFENLLIVKGFRFPFGVSCYVVVRK